MPFDSQKYVASVVRVSKSSKLAGRWFNGLAFGALAVAAALARFAPKASIALAGVFTSALAIRWFAQRGLERLVAMTDRGDVEALRAVPDKWPERFVALVALVVFDGTAAVAAIDDTFCGCGEPGCPIDGFDTDLAAVLTAFRGAESGESWKESAKIVIEAEVDRSGSVVGGSIAALRVTLRNALVRYMLFRSGIPNPLKTVDDPLRGVVGYGRVLRAPLLFAAASHAKRRGDLPMARELLAKLQPWKPGSRLAEQRAKLERTIAVST